MGFGSHTPPSWTQLWVTHYPKFFLNTTNNPDVICCIVPDYLLKDLVHHTNQGEWTTHDYSSTWLVVLSRMDLNYNKFSLSQVKNWWYLFCLCPLYLQKEGKLTFNTLSPMQTVTTSHKDSAVAKQQSIVSNGFLHLSSVCPWMTTFPKSVAQ